MKPKNVMYCIHCNKIVKSFEYETGSELECECQNTLYSSKEFFEDRWKYVCGKCLGKGIYPTQIGDEVENDACDWCDGGGIIKSKEGRWKTI
jgi:DnaJ-class molecular chaperone